MASSSTTKFVIWALSWALLIVGCHRTQETSPLDPRWYYPDGGIRPKGFREVAQAKDGDRITLVGWIDRKYVCHDVTKTQHEICTTVLDRGSEETFESLELKLRLCSADRRTNCIVWDDSPEGPDFRNVFMLDHKGAVFDFDGEELIEPPNTWTSHAQKVRLTGTVSVIDGEGRLFKPIEKIEPE